MDHAQCREHSLNTDAIYRSQDYGCSGRSLFSIWVTEPITCKESRSLVLKEPICMDTPIARILCILYLVQIPLLSCSP